MGRLQVDRGFPHWLWAAVALFLVVATACSSARDEAGQQIETIEQPTITMVAHEYGFEVPEIVPAGRVKFRLSNRGVEAHAAQLYRLDEGVTLERFGQAMNAGITSERDLATVVGGLANVDGGETGPLVEVTLKPGNHVVVCWLLSPTGAVHAFRGMIKAFRVADQGEIRSTDTSIDGSFELTEYDITVPDDFDGAGSYRVMNRGEEWHELVILRIGKKHSAKDALDHVTGVRLQNPVPYTSMGGVSGLEVDGGEAVITLDLEPGRYLFLCAVPNAREIYHANLGMWTEVRIP